MLARRYKIANSVVLLRDGRVLIAGGAPRAEIHDPATAQSVAVRPQLGGSLNFATATFLAGGGALIAGGYYEDGLRMNRRAWRLKKISARRASSQVTAFSGSPPVAGAVRSCRVTAQGENMIAKP